MPNPDAKIMTDAPAILVPVVEDYLEKWSPKNKDQKGGWNREFTESTSKDYGKSEYDVAVKLLRSLRAIPSPNSKTNAAAAIKLAYEHSGKGDLHARITRCLSSHFILTEAEAKARNEARITARTMIFSGGGGWLNIKSSADLLKEGINSLTNAEVEAVIKKTLAAIEEKVAERPQKDAVSERTPIDASTALGMSSSRYGAT